MAKLIGFCNVLLFASVAGNVEESEFSQLGKPIISTKTLYFFRIMANILLFVARLTIL